MKMICNDMYLTTYVMEGIVRLCYGMLYFAMNSMLSFS